jgi:hypothetical protein
MRTPGLITSRSCLQVSYILIYYLLHRTHFPHAMASEIDQILHTTGDATTTDAKTLFGAKSDIVVASSSNVAIENMVKKDVHVLTHY